MTNKTVPQVMVKSSWADAKAGDYFECYPDKGEFVSVEFGESGIDTLLFVDTATVLRRKKVVTIDRNDPRVFIRRPIAVGMPCTASFNGDSYPCEVLSWSPSGHQVHVLWGRSKAERTYTLRKNGRYFEKGDHSGFSLMFGVAESKMNPEF
jgi:hypothetical protein